ncbi:alpha/beta fold hydrolase [Synechococcales cyanobacterium C]|uniref:Alpha/beta fold hydrolase n=1 Tax=Petrachloros mirabilis ULC683 TaxID=2781853 RepID=A0A8K2A8U5_9CYAN|nr:alpha/beta fold hydrolase [Petrachloros mirabilis]NCJ08419.1 alpha/beta fold hydrolase [Petrachloros mirabilis ULC683]
MTTLPQVAPSTQVWHWQGQAIRYQYAGTQGKAIILIHGFGASSDHWRHNLPELAQHHRVFAIDLLGFGGSAKPNPSQGLPYTFETWADQILGFCQSVVGEAAFLVANSIGCIVALQAAVTNPDWVRGVGMLNCSLRLLHDRKRITLPWHRRSFAPLVQKLLTYRVIGYTFFHRLANAQVIRKILLQAYGRKAAVTDELVSLLLKPALDPGAADVFLAFTSYSQGPLPEELLPQVTCPVLILWGEADPWEPIALGQELANFPAVEDFITLEGIGHCPQDEAPEVVNPLILNWVSSM